MRRPRGRASVEELIVRIDRPMAPPPAFAAGLERRLMAEIERGQEGRALDGRAQAGRDVSDPLLRGRPAAVPTLPPAPMRPAPGRRMGPVSVLATAALFLLILGGTLVPARFNAVRRDAAEPRGVALLATDDAGRLRRLDPATLTDLPVVDPLAATPLPGAAAGQGEGVGWLGSADGSTLLRAEFRGDGEMTVATFDVATGGGRTEFALPFVFLLFPDLTSVSPDGSRLVVRELDASSAALGDLSDWHVVDTSTGQVLATVEDDAPTAPAGLAPSPPWGWVVDDTTETLYRLVMSEPPDGSGPVPVALRADGLTDPTDRAVRTLDLPEVFAGAWWSGTATPAGGESDWRAKEGLNPALAISRDGTRLAVVHGDGSAVTVVDTRSLTIERTVRLDPAAATPVRRFVDLTEDGADVEPSSAAETLWWAAYADDGQALYLSGVGFAETPGGMLVRAYGLRRIDLETGSVLAQADVGWAQAIVPASDGSGVYIVRPEPMPIGEGGSETYGLVLERLDPATLTRLAGPVEGLQPSIAVVEGPGAR